MMTKYLKKVFNTNTSLDYIRQFHIINFVDGGKRSNNEKAIFAAYCGHSMESKYCKI